MAGDYQNGQNDPPCPEGIKIGDPAIEEYQNVAIPQWNQFYFDQSNFTSLQ